MITAKDIHRKKFEQVKFGYNPEEVEGFLAELERDFRLMEQQLSDSNDKLQLLADKVRDYKETEEDLRNALVGAQKQAREVIEAAKAKAAQIEADAAKRGDSVKAEAIVGQEEQLHQLEAEIDAKKKEIAQLAAMAKDFRQVLLNTYKTHLKQIAAIPTAPVSVEVPEAPAPQPKTDAAPAAEAPVPAAEVQVSAAEAPVVLAKPQETAPAESAVPAEPVKPAEPETPAQPAAESAPAAEQNEPDAAFPHSSAIVNDPFAAEDAEKLRRNEMQFGSRRDDKRRRR